MLLFEFYSSVFFHMLKNHWQIYIQLIGRESLNRVEFMLTKCAILNAIEQKFLHVTLFMDVTFFLQTFIYVWISSLLNACIHHTAVYLFAFDFAFSFYFYSSRCCFWCDFYFFFVEMFTTNFNSSICMLEILNKSGLVAHPKFFRVNFFFIFMWKSIPTCFFNFQTFFDWIEWNVNLNFF